MCTGGAVATEALRSLLVAAVGLQAGPAGEEAAKEASSAVVEEAAVMASASPARDYDEQDEEEPSSISSDSANLVPAINCEVAGESGMYGQFTWTVTLPAAPADKDSLADISKIRQFRYARQHGAAAVCVCIGPLNDIRLVLVGLPHSVVGRASCSFPRPSLATS